MTWVPFIRRGTGSRASRKRSGYWKCGAWPASGYRNSCAFGMFCAMCHELMVGIITSLAPLRMKVGWRIVAQVGERRLAVELGQVMHVGLDLGLDHLGRTRRVRVRALVTALPERAAGLLRGWRAAEEQEQEVLQRRHRARRALQHAGVRIGVAAARPSADQHELAHQAGVAPGQVLGLIPAEREAQHVDLAQADAPGSPRPRRRPSARSGCAAGLARTPRRGR
jgi:hypothetical protein